MHIDAKRCFFVVRMQVAQHNQIRIGEGKDRHHNLVIAETCEKARA
jgi:hypothetical protein